MCNTFLPARRRGLCHFLPSFSSHTLILTEDKANQHAYWECQRGTEFAAPGELFIMWDDGEGMWIAHRGTSTKATVNLRQAVFGCKGNFFGVDGTSGLLNSTRWHIFVSLFFCRVVPGHTVQKAASCPLGRLPEVLNESVTTDPGNTECKWSENDMSAQTRIP